jgi:hypothetical protein
MVHALNGKTKARMQTIFFTHNPPVKVHGHNKGVNGTSQKDDQPQSLTGCSRNHPSGYTKQPTGYFRTLACGAVSIKTLSSNLLLAEM